MNTKSVFGNFRFGPVNSAKLSHLGIAVTNQAGDLVSYDKAKNEIVNVEMINFEGRNLAYMMPIAIKDIAVGDAIMHNGVIMFVTSVKTDIVAIDVKAGEKKIILPTKSMFGFDFITKVISLIDFGAAGASAESPFGNLMPLMLLGNGDMDMSTLMMLSMMNGNKGFDMSNPMMLMALMSGKERGSNDNIPFLLAMSMMNPNFANGLTSTPKTATVPTVTESE